MKILSEKDETIVNMEVDFTEKEYNLMLNYAQDNMSTEELDRLMIEWSLIDIIKKDLIGKEKEFPEK